MTPQTMAASTFGVGILSSVIGGYGKYQQGQGEKAAYDYNADITLENMRQKIQTNTENFTGLVGRQATAYAGAGVDIASGSPLLIMAATAARGGKQGEMIRQSGTEEANLQRYYGKLAAWGGTMAGIGSFLSGISNAAAGYESATAKLPKPSAGNIPTGTMGDGWSEAD